eukprot:Nitzschia sp. Nitz4//scaffold61_size107673//50336//54256//NITZ4_004236-RA/size107673-snap-gene-0.46-mRNA-1//1//CDS//3329555713//1480//frame0
MSFFDELITVAFLTFGVPNGVITFPASAYLIGRFLVGNLTWTFAALGALMLPLAILPQPYTPSVLHSWLAMRVLKYFSFRLVFDERPPPQDSKDPEHHPRILVAPPHGVFPYGNFLAMMTYPALCGSYFRGLAASAIVNAPVSKQILQSIGVVEASRSVARKVLERGESVGLSSGGVAEIFETNSEDQCIVLKPRIGLIRLAIRTGADLVPCYLFGNTKLLGCWTGEGVPQGRSILEAISRKTGIACITIHGRFGLPIPYRVPILAAMGKPIPTHHLKCEDPTNEQIEIVQEQLFNDMRSLFDRYKGLYGWEGKQLVIKTKWDDSGHAQKISTTTNPSTVILTMTKRDIPKQPKAEFLDFCSLGDADAKALALGTSDSRAKACIPIENVSKSNVLSHVKMSFFEELVTVLFLGFGVPCGVFTVPPTVYLIGRYLVGNVTMTFGAFSALMLPLAILPQSYQPAVLHNWMAFRVLKYFSYRFLFEERPPTKNVKDPDYRPQILVAPPHGVFPFGNLLAMMIWPALSGSYFRGLAATSALSPPVFKQVLRSMGTIDASRHIARKALENGDSVGISTGGVAEIFETNSKDQCIVLKSRIGLIKLAIRTGADLVPCYLFGNTEILSCWAGEGIPGGRNFLEWISRKVGVAFITFYGRFGLPIPRRVPILGALGKPIPTHHIQCEDPSDEQVAMIQKQLLDEMEGLFDRYKHLYGWEDKKLVINFQGKARTDPSSFEKHDTYLSELHPEEARSCCPSNITMAKEEEAQFLNFCDLSDDAAKKLAEGTPEDRVNACIPVSKATKELVQTEVKMTLFEEVTTMAFLAFGVPNGIFTIPPVTYLIGRFVVGNVSWTFGALGIALLPLVILPQPFRPDYLHSWIAMRVLKYFSYRFVFEDRPPPKNAEDPNYRPRIMVAPPHGVFPYGNLLAMMTWPALSGSPFRGLAASSALRMPIFKQILCSVGVIHASRSVARKALEEKESLGISTGGVAEVFETNADDQCIVLKTRIGMIKLAIRTGADLVPCYLFGNTDLLGCWAGEGIPEGRNILEKISRKVGFALIWIYGRFGLPIPYRIPILGVMGKPIPTYQIKSENPTDEQCEAIMKQLVDEMQGLFDRYKGLYGWENKKLIIK